MRKVKFRGFYPYWEMYDMQSGWIIGYLKYDPDDDEYLIQSIEEGHGQGEGYYVDKDSIGQYTGLKDDNGVEIYEGDIVKLVWDGEETTLEVVFDLEELAYLGRDVRYVVPKYKYLSVNDEIKVIGNTYENPELLEAVRK